MDAGNFARFTSVILALVLTLRITPLCLKNYINSAKWNYTPRDVPNSKAVGRALVWRSRPGSSKLIKAKSGWKVRATMKRNYPAARSLSKSPWQNKEKLPKRASEVFLLQPSIIFCTYHLAISVKIGREPHS